MFQAPNPYDPVKLELPSMWYWFKVGVAVTVGWGITVALLWLPFVALVWLGLAAWVWPFMH